MQIVNLLIILFPPAFSYFSLLDSDIPLSNLLSGTLTVTICRSKKINFLVKKLLYRFEGLWNVLCFELPRFTIYLPVARL
jgi:hypothetical protein